MTPEAIFNAMTLGRMQIQAHQPVRGRAARGGSLLRRQTVRPGHRAGRRQQVHSVAGDDAHRPRRGEWNGWGGNVANTRFQPNGGLTAADLPQAEIEMGVRLSHGVTSARAQPTIAGGRLFVASENGEVHALDPKTGCTYWTFKAQAGVRTAMSVGPYKNGSRRRARRVLRRRARQRLRRRRATGQQFWVAQGRRASRRRRSPARRPYYDGRVFVPVQGLSEEGQGGTGKYECCTFRGSLSALDANTGAVVWKTYTIGRAEAARQEQGRRAEWGPAGGGIWSAPTVDPKRGMVYVATGNGYADPPQQTTDAVIAST